MPSNSNYVRLSNVQKQELRDHSASTPSTTQRELAEIKWYDDVWLATQTCTTFCSSPATSTQSPAIPNIQQPRERALLLLLCERASSPVVRASLSSQLQSPVADGVDTRSGRCSDRVGTVVSSHEPAEQVSGGTRPTRELPDQALVDALVASGLLESGDEELPCRKHQHLHMGGEEETKGDSEESGSEGDGSAVSDDTEWVVSRVLDRRGRAATMECLVQWQDRSSQWLPLAALDKCKELVATYDRYLKEYPEKNVPYAQLIAADLPSTRLMVDSPKDDCALHAARMALELMGGLETTVLELETLLSRFLSRMPDMEYKRVGGLKYTQLIKFLREEMPKTGWFIDLDTFSKNWFKGDGVGPVAVASLAWQDDDSLTLGVYLVHAFKPSHCVAMKTNGIEMVVREDSVNTGIMAHDWIRNVSFVRKVMLRLASTKRGSNRRI